MKRKKISTSMTRASRHNSRSETDSTLGLLQVWSKKKVVTSFVRNVSNVRIFPYIKSRYVRNVRNVSNVRNVRNVGNVRNSRVPQRVVSGPKIPALANLSSPIRVRVPLIPAFSNMSFSNKG